MKKHAYLIIAHNNFYCLQKLLLLLDDERNDIFLHIDAKVNNFDFPRFQSICKQANVIYPKRRINVQWGTQSQVLTEMLLFETASRHGPYHYYHLISGVDLPLKTQNEIHDYLVDKTESFLFYREEPTKWDYYRVSRYNILVGNRSPMAQRIKSYSGILQDKLSIDRIKKRGMNVKKGSNWCSIHHDAVDMLLRSKRKIIHMTRFSVCADEVYKQTILLHENCPIVCNDLRLVEWMGGNHPRVYQKEDFVHLIRSDRFFARKFDENVDKQIIDMVFGHVMQQQLQEAKDENRSCNHL